MKKILVGILGLLSLVTLASATKYTCVSYQKTAYDVSSDWNKDGLVVYLDEHKARITMVKLDSEKNAKVTLYNTGEIEKVKNNSLRVYKNDTVSLYVGDKPVKNGIYLIFIKISNIIKKFVYRKEK